MDIRYNITMTNRRSTKNCACFAILIAFIVSGCSEHQTTMPGLAHTVDSLTHELAVVYKPGIGEFMSSIQVHHEKLWFAGQARNWALASFELHEMGEAFDGVKQFGNDTVALALLPMIDSALATVTSAVESDNPKRFTEAFTRLTADCNSCHRATQHNFMVIRLPTTIPFSNQVFENQAQ